MSDIIVETTPATTEPAGAQDTAPTGQADARTFTQADLDQIVKDRLARSARASETAAAKAAEDARQKALSEQGEYQKLATERAARIAELEPLAAQVERYGTALSAQVAALRDGLPAHVTVLLDRMDVADQLEYLAANRAKLIAPVALPTPPSPPNLNGGGPRTAPAQDEATRLAELQQRYPALKTRRT